MNRKERKHEHGLCQIAVFTFIEYDTQTMCKYVRTKSQNQSLNIFLNVRKGFGNIRIIRYLKSIIEK